MAKGREPRTLLEHVYVRTGGLRATYRVGMLIQQWAIVHRDLGRRPTVAEYANWWKVTERTAYNQLADFAKAFPDEHGPDRIAEALLERADELRADFTPAWVLGSSPAAVPSAG